MYWSIIYFIIIFQIFFPVIIQRHWVLIYVNLLYKTLNFFDSVKMTSKQDIERILKNLVCFPLLPFVSNFSLSYLSNLFCKNNFLFQATNFSTLCLEANVFSEVFNHFKSYSPANYPYEAVVYALNNCISLICHLFNNF